MKWFLTNPEGVKKFSLEACKYRIEERNKFLEKLTEEEKEYVTGLEQSNACLSKEISEMVSIRIKIKLDLIENIAYSEAVRKKRKAS